MPKFKKNKGFKLDSPLNASKNGGYAPFKMKNSPIKHKVPNKEGEKVWHTWEASGGKFDKKTGKKLSAAADKPHSHGKEGFEKNPGGAVYPAPTKSAFKDASTKEHPHEHLKNQKALERISVKKKTLERITKAESPAPYAPFKMKGHTLPGINQKSEGNTDLKNGRSGSAAFQAHDDTVEGTPEWERTHWPDGESRSERELFEYDNVTSEEERDNLRQRVKTEDKEGTPNNFFGRMKDKLGGGGAGAGLGMLLGGPIGALAGGLIGRRRDKRAAAAESGLMAYKKKAAKKAGKKKQ